MGIFVNIPVYAWAIVVKLGIALGVFVPFLVVGYFLSRLYSHVVKNAESNALPAVAARRMAHGGRRIIYSVLTTTGAWIALERIGVPLYQYFMQLLYIPAGLAITSPLRNWIGFIVIVFEYGIGTGSKVEIAALPGRYIVQRITTQHVELRHNDEPESCIVFVSNAVFIERQVVLYPNFDAVPIIEVEKRE